MSNSIKISEIQADILTTAAENMGDGQRLPLRILHICPTWSAPLTGLIRRGFLLERRRNMYDLTPQGEAALVNWQNDVPELTVYS